DVIAFLDPPIAIPVDVLWPARHDGQCVPRNDGALIQLGDFIRIPKQAVALQAPNLPQLHSFVILENTLLLVVKARDMRAGVRTNEARVHTEWLVRDLTFITVGERNVPTFLCQNRGILARLAATHYRRQLLAQCEYVEVVPIVY